MLERFGVEEIPLGRTAALPLKGHYEYTYDFHRSKGLTLYLPRAMAEPAGLRAPDFFTIWSLSWQDVAHTLVPNRRITTKPDARP